MRTYIVEPADSPGKIAVKFAECPKCSRDLILANADKKRVVVHANGYLTFESLTPGETLVLPEKWFDPGFDLLPPAYFASLPYADGVTPSPFGADAPVILGHFKALDVAAEKLRALASLNDQAFARSIGDVAEALDHAVEPALYESNEAASRRAFSAKEMVRFAVPAAKMFTAFAASGVSTAGVRSDVLEAFGAALDHARHALGDLYGAVQPSKR